jgi:hypothetical protein
MSIVTTTIADDDADPQSMGDLGKFKFKKLKKFVKPLTSIAKPLLSMGQGGGLLTAMGPWGWAAGAAVAAGGALAAKHKKKKMKARQKKAQHAAMAQQQEMPPPGYEYPPAVIDQSQPAEAMIMPDGYSDASSAAMPIDSMPAAMPSTMPEASSEPAMMIVPQDTEQMAPADIREVQATLDPEPVTMAGLGNAPETIVGIDWRALSALAGFTLGTWWLLRGRRPSPRSRRR